jgi:pyrroloquinoline quinone (PQQ) biosynthesis protein C
MGQLVELYQAATAVGPGPALAVIAAYESQAAEIAATKSAALRVHYGFSVDETGFWDVHAQLERSHATWTNKALVLLEADASSIHQWATWSAMAWWTFLDEQNEVLPP